MMDHEKQHGLVFVPQSGHSSWMVSLADLLALMLTFFVLLFSMNAVQVDDWRAVLTSFRKEFNPERAQIVSDTEADAQSERQFIPWAVSLEYLAPLLTHQLDEHGYADASVQRVRDRLIVSLPTEQLFSPGTARLNPKGKALLAELSIQLNRIGNDIALASSSKKGAYANSAYDSDWELTLRRSEAVGAFLTQAGFDRPLIAYGLGAFSDTFGRSQADKVQLIIMAWSGGGMHAH